MDFDCPRCERKVTERFYGPCEWCRDELAHFAPHAEVIPSNIVEAEPPDNRDWTRRD